MPTETTRRGIKRWRAVVKVSGKIVASKWFGSGSKEHRKAVLWEEEWKRSAVQQISRPVQKLSDWTLAYLEDVQVRFARSTFEEKRTAMARLIKSLGDLEVAKITPGVALGFLSGQCRARSGYSANRDRKNLAAAWTWARKFMDGFPKTGNPFLDVDKFPEERSPRHVPTEEEFWSVLAKAEGQDRVMLTAFLYTAARRDELFRLTWADVDFKENVLLLRTRKTRGSSWRVDPLPILPELRQALVWWWDARPYKSAEYVFTCLDDSPSPNHNPGGRFLYRQHVMRKLCKRAEVRPFGFHSIRHLRAVMLYKGGALVHEIQKWLRHESASTTERYLKSLGCDLDRLQEAATRGRGQAKVIPFAQNGRTPGSVTSEGSGYPPVYPLAETMATGL